MLQLVQWQSRVAFKARARSSPTAPSLYERCMQRPVMAENRVDGFPVERSHRHSQRLHDTWIDVAAQRGKSGFLRASVTSTDAADVAAATRTGAPARCEWRGAESHVMLGQAVQVIGSRQAR
ncbi:MAG TPA: hypothetical protein VMV10_14710 [Pirellulales bacterium]|nr:hypothetical protein [Pirellulales bacterium]